MNLFDPFELKGIALRNRIAMSPMSQNSAGEDACATDWHLVHYGSRAVGGCGVVLFEDTAVMENGRVSGASLGLYDDRHVEGLKRIVSFCRDAGAVCGIQIAHAGRKAFRDRKGAGIDLIASMPEAFHTDWATPRTATASDIAEVIEGFVQAARRAKQAGFQMVEIHAAHGYLLHQFLSPALNRRTDDWGGDAEGRSRLLFEVLTRVQAVIGEDCLISVRLPYCDGLDDGLTEEDIFELSRRLVAQGADLIDIAAGNLRLDARPPESSAQLALAQRLMAGGILTMAGGSKDAQHASQLVKDDVVGLLLLGRPILKNPYWPLAMAEALGEAPMAPRQYALAF